MIEEARIALIEAFSDIHLIEEEHTYIHDNFMMSVPSVSSQIKELHPEFDTHNIAKNYVAKWNKRNPDNKKTTAQVIQEWSDKNLEAITKGNRVHKFAEGYPLFGTPKLSEEKGVVEWYGDLDDKYEVVVLELPVCYETYFAGTPDKILMNVNTGKLIISDWKTNKDLFKNFANRKLFKPFNNMLDCPFNKYIIQLNHYKLAIEESTDYKVEDMWIVWLKEDAVFSKKPRKAGQYYVEFKVPNITKKIKQMYNK